VIIRTGRASERCSEERHRDAGAAAVELVVILPIILVLVFGTLAIGAAYFLKLNVTEAAREGARYGATLRTGVPNDSDKSGAPTTQWLREVADVTAATAGSWETLCVAYTGNRASPAGGVITSSLRRTNGGVEVIGGTQCFSDGRPSEERRVQVLVTNTGPFDNFFAFQRTLNLRGAALARFERPYTPYD
jgi:Flp pilus assembly protein TadG